MKNIFICIFTLSLFGGLYAQEDAKDRKLNDGSMAEIDKQGWTTRGTNSLLFNQASFSNWVSGGTNSVGLLANLDYEFNYRKGKSLWDNRVAFGYGLQTNEGESTRKTEDVIDLTSKFRRQIKESHWYLGSALNFKTQFTKGYDYSEETVTVGSVDFSKEVKTTISNFLAPGYLLVGGGVDFIPNENFELNIHPLTSKMTFVTDDDVKVDSNGDLRYGLDDANDSFVYELGLYVGARQRMTLMKNITLDHQIGLYSNYLEDPDHIDISYTALLNMQINKYISAQFTGDLLYDHDILNDEGERRLQTKQSLGIGLTYSFE